MATPWKHSTWPTPLERTKTFPRLREVMMPLIFQYLNYVGFYTKPTTLFLLIYLILPSIYPIDTLYQLHHHHAQTVYPQPRRATGSCGFSVLNYLGCSTRLPTTNLFTIFTNNRPLATASSRTLLQCLFPPSPHCLPMHPRSETATTLSTSPLSRFSAVILNRINHLVTSSSESSCTAVARYLAHSHRLDGQVRFSPRQAHNSPFQSLLQALTRVRRTTPTTTTTTTTTTPLVLPTLDTVSSGDDRSSISDSPLPHLLRALWQVVATSDSVFIDCFDSQYYKLQACVHETGNPSGEL